ncbi:hypothetical protein CN154_15225 [Sinorhizobium meliloti]|uniref:tyrosine-type recombinase/integrase n=1 Tax=Rhizobium meliloti TaxID=382 RepID=UPI000FD9147A|nr:hypothetical protein [Sinorhizobium meliloti]RVK75453.1 hypothetical protein CN154_15225 [Sinorhizobium meliloti]
MSSSPKIKHVVWRDGRPRFEPSPTLRKLGYKGEDLKTADGRWMTAGEALDWSNAFAKQLAGEKRKTRMKKTGRHEPTPVPAAPALKPTYPVRQLFDDWLNVSKNPSIADRAENTMRDYRQKAKVFENHMPDVYAAEAEALTKPICIGLYDVLRAKAGIATAAGAMRILGIALQWAMDRGKFPDMHVNPAHKLRMKVPDPRIRFATKQEMKVLVETADAMGAHEMGDMFTLAVWSGQRQGDRLEFQLAGREAGRVIFRQAKTKVIVSMPEAPELKKRFTAAQKRRQTAEVISPYVILNEEDWKPFKADRYRRRYEDIRRAAAKVLPSLKTLRDQDFRDTAVTWLAMADCTIPQICAITGHSFKTANDILKHYLAMNPELADSAMAKMISWFEKEETK